MNHLRTLIKSLIIKNGFTVKEFILLLNKEYGWHLSPSNFANKITRQSLRYHEAECIASLLGYEIVWQKRGDKSV